MILLYSETLYKIYTYSGSFFVSLIFILAIYSIYNIKYFKSIFKWLFYLIIGYVFFELLVAYAQYIGISDNRFINHLYSIFALVLGSVFYSKTLKNPNINTLILLICSIFLVLEIYQIFSSKGIVSSPIPLPLMNILFSFLSILVFNKMLKSPYIKSVTNEPLFWFNIGFFIMNLFQLALVPLFNQMILISDDLAFIIGTIKNLGDPITYTLWAYGVYKLSTQPFKPISSLWP